MSRRVCRRGGVLNAGVCAVKIALAAMLATSVAVWWDVPNPWFATLSSLVEVEITRTAPPCQRECRAEARRSSHGRRRGTIHFEEVEVGSDQDRSIAGIANFHLGPGATCVDLDRLIVEDVTANSTLSHAQRPPGPVDRHSTPVGSRLNAMSAGDVWPFDYPVGRPDLAAKRLLDGVVDRHETASIGEDWFHLDEGDEIGDAVQNVLGGQRLTCLVHHLFHRGLAELPRAPWR